MPIIRREELIEFAYKFLRGLTVWTEVLPDVNQHRPAPHEKEIPDCAVIAND